MVPSITNKQKEILLLLYRFRFLNRIQVQKLLNHKSCKNTLVWLKDLTEKGYTERIFEKVPGINKPAIYYVSKNGIKFLKSSQGVESEYLRKLYQENRRSNSFIEQAIQIADIYLELRAQNLPGFKFYTQSDFPVRGIIRELLPSFAYIQTEQDTIKQYSCELVKPGTPRFAIRARIQKYFEFFNEQPNVEILFYCTDKKLSKYIEKYAAKYSESEDLEIEFVVKTIS